MSGKRVIYRNWIVDFSRDPRDDQIENRPERDPGSVISLDGLADWAQDGLESVLCGENTEDSQVISDAVNEALSGLDEEDREMIQRFHFMGQTYVAMAEETGRSVYRLEGLHRRAVKKLRKKLAAFVRDRYELAVESNTSCPICASPRRAEIDRLISHRDKTKPWTQTIGTLKKEYGIKITTPQTLIGHEKYH